MYININNFYVLISPFFSQFQYHIFSYLLFFINILTVRLQDGVAQKLVDQVALMLRALHDEHSVSEVHLPAARVHISEDPMTLRGHGDAGKCPDEDNKSSVAFLRESRRRVVTVAVGYAARPIQRVV